MNRQQGGFGHSRKQLATELALVVAALALLVFGGYWAVSEASASLVTAMPVSVDTTIGKLAFEQLASPDNRCDNPALTDYVEKLAAPLLEVAQAPFDFHFVVLDDDAVNAFALPGGYVAVNRGLLQKATSGEEVAGVLAHELQHALRRHGLKRIARQAGASITVGMLLGWMDAGVLASAASGLVGRSYDRAQESEADRLGRQLLLDAGIKPDGMAQFFERLAEQGPSVPTWLSTHPDSGERAQLARTGPRFEGRPRRLQAPGDWPCQLEEKR